MYVILRGGVAVGEGEREEGWPLCNLEIIRGSLPSSAAIREYGEGGSGSKSRAVISKMAQPLNDNSQASLPASPSFTAAD